MIQETKESNQRIGLVRICGLLGVTRQASYQHSWRQSEVSIEQGLILEEVQRIRSNHPVLGGRKLYVLLQPFMLEHQIKMGRDALFNLLGENNLLVRKKRRQTITTYSRHWMKKYPNLIKNKELTASNQLWVSDITYLRTQKGFLYASLITDAYSHRIMGYHVVDSLETIHSIKALKMALSSMCKPIVRLIHHSDRGVQYCSSEYVKVLQDHGIAISMTENGDPLENPVAERINGIIKNEYLFNHKVRDRDHAKLLLKRAVDLYNTERPHMSLGMLAPDLVHELNLSVKREWKNYYLNKTVLNQKQLEKL